MTECLLVCEYVCNPESDLKTILPQIPLSHCTLLLILDLHEVSSGFRLINIEPGDTPSIHVGRHGLLGFLALAFVLVLPLSKFLQLFLPLFILTPSAYDLKHRVPAFEIGIVDEPCRRHFRSTQWCDIETWIIRVFEILVHL